MDVKFAIMRQSGAIVVYARNKKEAFHKFINKGYKVKMKEIYSYRWENR